MPRLSEKWRAWADEHIDCLTDRRCLFDCYGFTPLDGSAHICVDHGYLFIFNTSDMPAVAHIPLCSWIGLTAVPHTRFAVETLYPDAATLGVASLGDTLCLTIPPRSANLFSLMPTDAPSAPLPPPDPKAPVVEAFKRPTNPKGSMP